MSASFALRGQASSIGRDPGNDICIRDDPKVSRRHAQIRRDGGRYAITDLGSSNGTYVNGARVNSAALNDGDRIRVGAAEFQLQGDQLISTSVDATVVMRAGGGGAAPRPVRPAGKGGMGMGWIPVLLGIGVVLVLATNQMGKKTPTTGQPTGGQSVIQSGAGVATLDTSSRSAADGGSQGGSVMTSTDIFAAGRGSVVFLEIGWKLIATETGQQVYQLAYMTDEGSQAVYRCAIDDAARCLSEPKLLIPVLTLEPGPDDDPNLPIGGRHFGTGFVVSRDGFIITNKHVAAGWYAPIQFVAGKVFDEDNNVMGLVNGPQIVPMDLAETSGIGKVLEGRNDYFDVTFPDNSNRIRAQLVRTSDEHDVALVKVDIPQDVVPVELVDGTETVRTGDEVSVIGYPLADDIFPQFSIERSLSGMREADRKMLVPRPTIGAGNVARIIKKGDSDVAESDADVIQITAPVNHGNSGGPLFDDRGRVIGIVYAGFTADVAQGANFAVPAKYALDLMGVQPPRP